MIFQIYRFMDIFLFHISITIKNELTVNFWN